MTVGKPLDVQRTYWTCIFPHRHTSRFMSISAWQC
nr:MAG TPA: hypothetical protein [Caudoviricetes sp.]